MTTSSKRNEWRASQPLNRGTKPWRTFTFEFWNKKTLLPSRFKVLPEQSEHARTSSQAISTISYVSHSFTTIQELERILLKHTKQIQILITRRVEQG